MATTYPKYPDVTVALVGADGNALYIIGKVREALRRAGVDRDEIAACTREATAGDYDGVLLACLRWVEVE